MGGGEGEEKEGQGREREKGRSQCGFKSSGLSDLGNGVVIY